MALPVCVVGSVVSLRYWKHLNGVRKSGANVQTLAAVLFPMCVEIR